jgi:uncharacterized protein YcbK (DUF882 family)
MKDTNKARENLKKALSSVPADNAFSSVRYHINQALSMLEHVKKKQTKAASSQPTPAQAWNDMLKDGVQNPNHHVTKRTLDVINGMIEASKKRLDELKKKRQSAGSDSLGEELETLYD